MSVKLDALTLSTGLGTCNNDLSKGSLLEQWLGAMLSAKVCKTRRVPLSTGLGSCTMTPASGHLWSAAVGSWLSSSCYTRITRARIHTFAYIHLHTYMMCMQVGSFVNYLS